MAPSGELKLILVASNDPLIRTKLENFDFENPPIDPEQLATDLALSMQRNQGLGLSANQVGLNYRVFVMDGDPIYACFNPKIVMPSEEQVTLEEACLTFPGLSVKVKRPKSVKVRFQGPDGEVYTKTFTGMTARIFQHELDHLDGKVFYDRANAFHRNQAFGKWKQWKRKYKVFN